MYQNQELSTGINENTQITKYGGFYIRRYEAGKTNDALFNDRIPREGVYNNSGSSYSAAY